MFKFINKTKLKKIAAWEDKFAKVGEVIDPIVLILCEIEDKNAKLNWNKINNKESLFKQINGFYQRELSNLDKKIDGLIGKIDLTWSNSKYEKENSKNQNLNYLKQINNLKSWKQNKKILEYEEGDDSNYKSNKQYLYLILRTDSIFYSEPSTRLLQLTYEKLKNKINDTNFSNLEKKLEGIDSGTLERAGVSLDLMTIDKIDNNTEKFKQIVEIKKQIENKIKEYDNLEKRSKKKATQHMAQKIREFTNIERRDRDEINEERERIKRTKEYIDLLELAVRELIRLKAEFPLGEEEIETCKNLLEEIDRQIVSTRKNNTSEVYVDQENIEKSRNPEEETEEDYFDPSKIIIKEGWNVFPRLDKKQTIYEEDLLKSNPILIDPRKRTLTLQYLSQGCGWCTGGYGMAERYLNDTDFWIYVVDGGPVLAIRVEGERQEETAGYANDATNGYPYAKDILDLCNSYPNIKKAYENINSTGELPSGGQRPWSMKQINNLINQRSSLLSMIERNGLENSLIDLNINQFGKKVNLLSQLEISDILNKEDENSKKFKEKVKDLFKTTFTGSVNYAASVTLDMSIKRFMFLLDYNEVIDIAIKVVLESPYGIKSYDRPLTTATINVSRLNSTMRSTLLKDRGFFDAALDKFKQLLDLKNRGKISSAQNLKLDELYELFSGSLIFSSLNESIYSREARSNLIDKMDLSNADEVFGFIDTFSKLNFDFSDVEDEDIGLPKTIVDAMIDSLSRYYVYDKQKYSELVNKYPQLKLDKTKTKESAILYVLEKLEKILRNEVYYRGEKRDNFIKENSKIIKEIIEKLTEFNVIKQEDKILNGIKEVLLIEICYRSTESSLIDRLLNLYNGIFTKESLFQEGKENSENNPYIYFDNVLNNFMNGIANKEDGFSKEALKTLEHINNLSGGEFFNQDIAHVEDDKSRKVSNIVIKPRLIDCVAISKAQGIYQEAARNDFENRQYILQENPLLNKFPSLPEVTTEDILQVLSSAPINIVDNDFLNKVNHKVVKYCDQLLDVLLKTANLKGIAILNKKCGGLVLGEYKSDLLDRNKSEIENNIKGLFGELAFDRSSVEGIYKAVNLIYELSNKHVYGEHLIGIFNIDLIAAKGIFLSRKDNEMISKIGRLESRIGKRFVYNQTEINDQEIIKFLEKINSILRINKPIDEKVDEIVLHVNSYKLIENPKFKHNFKKLINMYLKRIIPVIALRDSDKLSYFKDEINSKLGNDIIDSQNSIAIENLSKEK